MTQTYQVIGTRPIRHDGIDKVTGRALYGADFQAAGLLHGRILRSPHAHAKIKKIDVSKALALPGVEAIITSADFPDPGDRMADLGEGAINVRHLSSNCLARDKVHYRGQAVAAVAAVSGHVAEEACKWIEIEYEVLPSVTDVVKAMQPGAPILHDDLVTQSMAERAGSVSDGTAKTNIAKHLQYKLGDTAKGFAEAAVVIERSFTTATVHQGYIEPHNASALWNADGTVTIWCSTQGAFTVRAQVAELLQMPVAKIKVVPMEIGGGFGGKIRVYLEPVAAILSKKTGKPVKVLMDRAACFEATGPTPGSFIRVKVGADKTGRITAAEAYLAYEAGAFPGSPIWAGCVCIFSCYDVPNLHVDGYDVCVNKPATSAYRAPGATNAAMAMETVVDEICEKLKIDPLEFRLKNAAHEGSRRADGPVFPRVGAIETVEAAKKHPHYTAALTKGTNPAFPRGRGVASGFWFNIGLKSSISAAVNGDGSVSMVEGSTDIGGTRTSIAMQLAEALGIGSADIKPSVGDTDAIGYTDVTGGSRVTYATGWAAFEAAKDIQRQMIDKVAALWKTSADELVYDAGAVKSKTDAAKKMTFKEIAAEAQKHGSVIMGRASVDPPFPGGAFATHIVDVEVDPETGKVSVLRYTAVQDCGKAIHPSYVEGQIQGGAVQGIGWGLSEEYVYNDKGAMTNASFLDYRMPTALDLPMIDAVIVEVPDPKHPFGVRGVGEVPIVPPCGALANAIYAAVGVRMDVLPMSPPRVCKAILAKGK